MKPAGKLRVFGAVVIGLSGAGCYTRDAQPTWAAPSYIQGTPMMGAPPPGAVAPAVTAAPAAAAAPGVTGGVAAPAPVASPVNGAPGAPAAIPAAPAGPAANPGVAQAGAPAPAAAVPGASMCNVPACLTNVLSRCAPMGDCTMNGDFGASTLCFANGVKLKLMVTFAAEIAIMTQQFNPDGTLCYSSDGMSAGDGINVTYRDPAGTVFATSTLNPMSMMATIACPGEQPVLIDGAACGAPGSMMMSGAMMMGPPQCGGTVTCM